MTQLLSDHHFFQLTSIRNHVLHRNTFIHQRQKLQSTFYISINYESGQNVPEQKTAEPADGFLLLPLVATAAADCDHNLRDGVAGHPAVVHLARHLVPETNT